MIDKDQVINLYEEGYAMFEIADKLAVPESIVREILRGYLDGTNDQEEDYYYDENE